MRFAITLTVAVLLAGAAWADTLKVNIKSFKYHDEVITIAVGDTIVWLNEDRARHTATARDCSFDTGRLRKGVSGEISFTVAGTYEYICTIHPSMKGTVVVK